MGMRSQIYIKYNEDGVNKIIARDYDGNYGVGMISRAKGIIEALNYDYWDFDEENRELLSRICDVNFDERDLIMSVDLVDEAATKYNEDYSCIFATDNTNGQLLIDATKNGVKYCFIPRYDNIAVMDGKEYLVWNSSKCHPDYRWTKVSHPKHLNENTLSYTFKNLTYLDQRATLMTVEEAEEFVNEDYSYLFTKYYDNVSK